MFEIKHFPGFAVFAGVPSPETPRSKNIFRMITLGNHCLCYFLFFRRFLFTQKH